MMEWSIIIFKFIWSWLIVPIFKLAVFVLMIGAVRLFLLGVLKRYDQSLRDTSILRRGDIILTGKQSVLSSWYIQISNVLTRKMKHRFWTHAAIYQGNGKVWEAQPVGVIEKDIDEYFKNGFLVRAFRHKYIQDESVLDQIVQFCADKKGYNYGTFGTIFYAFSTFMPISFNWLFDQSWIDRLLNLDNAYFCSELVVDAFKSTGYLISPYDGWRVKPTDFISNPLLAPVEA